MSNRQINSSRQRREKSQAKNTMEEQPPNRRPPKDTWGHKMKKKAHKKIRVSFVNVNGIGSFAKHEKSEGIRRHMVEKEVDIMGLAETNVNWKKVRNKDTLWDRTKEWVPDRRIGVSYNLHQRVQSKAQPGGTATIAVNDMAQRYKGSGYDESGVGRWSWIVVSGKQNCVTRFVTVYAPQKSGTGLNTVYEQQLSYFNHNPIQQFWNDLARAISSWQSSGEQLILMGDWNEEITGENLTLWMRTFGLTEAITSLHGQTPPPTYHRGSHAIDGIYVSPSIQVSRAGYLGFGDIPGDHRGIWIDVEQRSILGYKMADIPIAKARRLKLNDPRVVQRYQTSLDDFFTAHKLYERMRVLRSGIRYGYPLTDAQKREYEDIDTLRDKGMRQAAKRCRKLRMGGRQWSPTLQKARDTILFWTLIRRRLKKCKVGARRILRLKKKLGITTNTELPLQEVERYLAKAYKRYKVCRRNDNELRKSFLEELAQAKADKGNLKVATVLRNMHQLEATRRTFRRIRYSTKKGRSGTTKIHVQKRNRVKEVTKKEEMEKYIVAENEKKFHQTEGRCPLLHGQLYKDLGAMGDGPRVCDVLDGSYIPPAGTSPETVSWLQRMKIKDPARLRTIRTSILDFQRGWKLVKEQTASGELHMGHFKAGAMHSKLSWMHFEMSMMPMLSGYSPKRWQQGIDVMLLKAPDVYLLEKLRTIVLYEADFNHENKRLGRDAMQLALEQNLIADEQFSRPGRSAQDNALSKRLVFDFFRLQKRPFGMCACDLKSCYDRVVHTAASLALQRVGTPLPRIQCMFTTVQRLIHRIRTAFGLSEISFGGQSEAYRKPPQGMGQGNGAGPTVWSILSSTVFEELHARQYSSSFCYALSMGLYQLCGFSYVDDCDLLADGEDAEKVHTKLQTVITLWDKLMEVNGAAIAPDKCWWYLVDFTWNGGKWKYQDAGKEREITVRNKDNVVESLDYLTYAEAKEMVGVFLAPDGNHDEQWDALYKKAQTWAGKVRASPLDPDAMWVAMNCSIIKGLEYPLAATTLSKPQVDKIMSALLPTALPRSGLTRKFPHAVLYGPAELQGMGVTSLYDYQYCRHVQDIVDQTWRGTPTGRLIQINLEAVKVEAGLFGPLFDNPIEITWFNTTSSWIIDTYRYCRKHEIVFTDSGTHILPQCLQDEPLMQVFEAEGYTQRELVRLNRCRLYYQVTTLSDISDGTGTQLSPRWLHRSPPTHTTRYKWPVQGNPPKYDWDLWDAALQTTVCNTGLGLKYPLGAWTVPPEAHQWEYLVSSDDRLFKKTHTGWLEYTLGRRNRRGECRVQVRDGKFRHKLPRISLTRTVGWELDNVLRISGTRPIHTPYLRQPTCERTWTSTLRSSPHAVWICQWLSLPSCAIECATSLYQGKTQCVSDGSYDDKEDICSAGWVVVFDTVGEAKGGGVVPSPPGYSSAYRGELGGLLGILLLLWSLETFIPPKEKYRVTVACDGKSALFQSLLTSRDQCNSRQKSFDIISVIISIRDGLYADIEPIHVKGHQDKLTTTLTTLETLNIRMDRLAKEILHFAVTHDVDIPDALPENPSGMIQVDFEDVPIVSALASTLQFYVARNRILNWWKKKERFRPEVTRDDIDWEVLRRVSREHSFAMRRFVAKWVSHHIAVGKMMGLRSARKESSCPCCGSPMETTIHVLRCQSLSSRQQWVKGLKTLGKWMTSTSTDPEIQAAIYFALRQFNKEGNYETYVDPSLPIGELRDCVIAQSKIGWTGFLEGLISPKWAKVQQLYFRQIGSRRTGLRWATGLSKELWKLVFSMWDHRNSVLFAKGKVDELSGLSIVREAIVFEQRLGLGQLDPVFLPYIKLPAASFSKMKSIDLRRWLSLIRQAREEKGYQYADELAISPSL